AGTLTPKISKGGAASGASVALPGAASPSASARARAADSARSNAASPVLPVRLNRFPPAVIVLAAAGSNIDGAGGGAFAGHRVPHARGTGCRMASRAFHFARRGAGGENGRGRSAMRRVAWQAAGVACAFAFAAAAELPVEQPGHVATLPS